MPDIVTLFYKNKFCQQVRDKMGQANGYVTKVSAIVNYCGGKFWENFYIFWKHQTPKMKIIPEAVV